ncbi:hypothetical protein [Helicobacter pylori]|uniref:hypothetical protein n=1 Tax=Helicobacter pylori TaxID=210 RepID=UPI000AE1C0B8|nr:hypothetical protein [Helicobacter pylori]
MHSLGGMHAIIQKGVDNLTERLDNDLKDGDSRVYVPIGSISRLYGVGNMKPNELCLLLVEMFGDIRSQSRNNKNKRKK